MKPAFFNPSIAFAIWCACLAFCSLGAALYRLQTWPTQRQQVLVLDAETGHVYRPQIGVHSDKCRDWALREALSLRLGLGVYAAQPPAVLWPRIDAYWFQEKVEPGFSEMNTAGWQIERVVFRGNFAKVYLEGVSHFIQVNFWEIRREPPSLLNPLGYRFRAKVTLMSDRGLAL